MLFIKGQTHSLYLTNTNLHLVIAFVSSILCGCTLFIFLQLVRSHKHKLYQHSTSRSVLPPRVTQQSYFKKFQRLVSSRMIFDKSTSAEPVADANFDNHRNLYRERRDRFRNNPVAMRELAEWKAQNNSYEYTIM